MRGYIDNLVSEVGEGGLNSAERRIKNLLDSGEPVTYARLIREKKSEQFARTLTEKLMTYAIGRGIEYYDRCAIDKILSETSKNDYRFKDLLLAIITSDPFQRKGTKNIDDTSDPISIDNKPSNKTTDAKNTSEAKP
jgi:hypothetical protein